MPAEAIANEFVRLSNGVAMPAVGLGTYLARGTGVANAVKWALQASIRHIDTAIMYRVRSSPSLLSVHDRKCGRRLSKISAQVGAERGHHSCLYQGSSHSTRATIHHQQIITL